MRELGQSLWSAKAELDQLSHKGLQSGGTDSVVDHVAKTWCYAFWDFQIKEGMLPCGVSISETDTNFSALEIKAEGLSNRSI